MKIIKPDNLGLLFSPCMLGDNCCLSVAAMACFSLETRDDRLFEEAQMWQVVAGELGEEEALDLGYPKKRGEFLVYGAAHSPQAVTGLQVRVTVAGLSKTLNVSGARYWNAAGLPSAPEPFKETRVSWANAFGGEGWELNPTGMGMLPDQDGRMPLPQVQDPRHLVTSPKDRPEPAGFNTLNPFWPQRKRLLGTFDDAWLKKRWPHYPTNTDPEYFNTAPADQRLTGFFKGDELLRIENMHPEKAEITSVLPGLRARLFVNRVVEGKETFTEIEARPETVWLFPGADCGVLLFRGTATVTDETLDDVTHLMAEWEPLNAPPQPLDYYHQKFLATIAPVKAEPLEPSPVAAPEPPPPAAPPAAPPELPQPPEPPPLSPEAEKMMTDLNDKIAQANAQAAAVFAKLGMTREQAMAKVMPKPEPTVAPSQLELDKVIADAHQQADAVFAKLGISKEEALNKYLSPQAAPKDPQQEIKTLTDALQSVEAQLKKSGINIQEAAAKILPDIDPATLDFGTIIAGLTSLAATLPTAGEAAAPEAPEEETGTVAPPAADQTEETLDSVDAVMKRHTQGQKLCGLDLSDMDFSGRDLANADFSGSILANTTFTGAILTGAVFTDAVLADADFSRARMAQANLMRVQAVGATFSLVELKRADLSGGDFTGCNFADADLSTACLSGALFAKATLKECKVVGSTAVRTNFSKADLTGANLHRAVITAADFSGATLDHACFSETDGCQATFDGVQGTGADFSKAILIASRASKETNLAGALFSGADLTRSCWERASLSGACMAGAVLDDADFSRVTFARVYLVNATARGTNFMKTVMTSCDLRGVNFFKASFRHARLNQCDLKQANMFGTDLYGAIIVASDIQGTDFRRAQARSAQ
ncbi:DUF2169 domain-containing protein [uncultured Desulfobulbus sp.]|uniref:DUF2169 family type VI secretion system accessory protein n=1 Tax=uncultured Desulfobulbus sp. TaxID=239745 RepID=UPI0029C8A890|nr:DUF2169 domain-containing protein [uncultured Desulfobulbus sp.]